MSTKSVRLLSIISFCLFLFIVVKDLAVSYFQIIPVRGKLNRDISWFVIVPLSFIGIALSVIVLLNLYAVRKKKTKKQYLTIFMAVPILLYVAYFIFRLFYQLAFHCAGCFDKIN